MRLIDADRFKRSLDSVCYDKNVWGDIIEDIIRASKALADSQPTVDPVKHGHWIDDAAPSDDDGLVFRCSKCHYLVDIETSYCPNCGAKMDELMRRQYGSKD